MGYGTQVDMNRAKTLYQKSCLKRDPVACYELSAHFHDPKSGIEPNVQLSRALYQRACQDDHMLACARLAQLDAHLLSQSATADKMHSIHHDERQSYARVIKSLERACMAQRSNDCALLGDMYFMGSRSQQVF